MARTLANADLHVGTCPKLSGAGSISSMTISSKSDFPISENCAIMENMSPVPPVSNSAIAEVLGELAPIFGPQVSVDLRSRGRLSRGDRTPDYWVMVGWEGKQWEFAASAANRSTPRVVEETVRHAARGAAASGLRPMVLVPYLSEQRMAELELRGVSGIDLCGNGLVLVPGQMLLRRTGRPNRYPESGLSKFAYRGVTSLVSRAFIRRMQYSSVGEIRDEISAGGGAVALSTVSKALARMVEDLIVERSDGSIRLVQPEKLLDALLASYSPPKIERAVMVKTALGLGQFCSVAMGAGSSGPRIRMVLSGGASQDRYAAGLRADTPVLYVDDLDDLKRRLGDSWMPADRFEDLRIVETFDPTPFFDARLGVDGVCFASPVQAYLELAAGGDKRDSDMAAQVRARIMKDIRR